MPGSPIYDEDNRGIREREGHEVDFSGGGGAE